MRTVLLFFTILKGLACSTPVHAQVVYHKVYQLTSWEGQPVTISLSYKVFSKQLAVSCGGDSLFLREYTGTESVRVLQHRFLQINFETRCGSNCSSQSTAIVTIRQNKLLVSLLINSFAESEGFAPGMERAYRYRVTLNMPDGPKNHYTLRARVHEEETFKSQPSQNKTLNQQVILHWDDARRVFYSAFEPTARCLPVFDMRYPFEPGDLSALHLVEPAVYIPYVPVGPLWVAGIFPVIRLGGYLYYYIQGNWYEGPAKPKPDEFNWFVTNEVEYVPSRRREPMR